MFKNSKNQRAVESSMAVSGKQKKKINYFDL
jgi:hypothetical protein